MIDLMPVFFETLIILVIWVVATVITWPLRRMIHVAETAYSAKMALKDFTGRLSRPAVVLALTFPVIALLSIHPAVREWINEHSPHLTAWWTFWLVLLSMNFIEAVALQLSSLVGREFPMPALLRGILRAVVLTAAVFAILHYVLHVNISPLLASTALLTAVVGFALQGVLGNVLAGTSLHLARSITPGDWVAINDTEGRVIDSNWRETRLRNISGQTVLVPNSTVANAVIHNMSRPNTLRRHSINVGASYSDAPAEVVEALIASAKAVPAVLDKPAPTAYVTEFKDFGLNYELRFWTRQYFNRVPVEGDVNRMIWYQFKRHGIEIPFPMSDQLLNDFMAVVYNQRRIGPADEEIKERMNNLMSGQFQTLLSDEQGNPIIKPEELEGFAGAIRRVRYTKGETLFIQGDDGEICYIIVSGTLAGTITFEDNSTSSFESGPGTLIGEMSLMTGLPRTATVTVKTEVELLEIPPEAFALLLSLREDIPETLAKLVAHRAMQNAAAYVNLRSVPPEDVKKSLRRENIFSRFLQLLGGGLKNPADKK